MTKSPQANHGPKVKRALTQLGGEVEVWCDSLNLRDHLDQALIVELDDAQPARHVHGFHSYPARMHPDTALRLILALTEPGEVVLDPFCGSGTVLVEAKLQGRIAYGVDANPLSVALANLKLQGLSSDESESLLLGVAEAIAEFADDRRRAKAGPTKPYSREARAQFQPHVLLELDGLMKGIAELCPTQFASALRLVISSMLTKVSLRRSDTSGHQEPKRLASGFTIQFFRRKTSELARRLREYTALVPPIGLAAEAKLGDARRIPMNDGRACAIITSPPYPGVYDYVEHHRLRLDFLGLDVEHLESHEIGAHRDFARAEPGDAEAKWAEQFGACLSEMRRVLAPRGKVALLIADSVVARRPFYADQVLKSLAPQHGLLIVYGGSQRRAHFHAPTRDAFREAPRREHLIVLARDDQNAVQRAGFIATGKPKPETKRHAGVAAMGKPKPETKRHAGVAATGKPKPETKRHAGVAATDKPKHSKSSLSRRTRH